MRPFRCPASTEMLLKHLGRSGLVVLVCSAVLLGRLLAWLVRAVAWLFTKCRAKANV